MVVSFSFNQKKTLKVQALIPERMGGAIVGTIISDSIDDWAMVKFEDNTQRAINFEQMLPI